jgi:hypothetical protein
MAANLKKIRAMDSEDSANLKKIRSMDSADSANLKIIRAMDSKNPSIIADAESLELMFAWNGANFHPHQTLTRNVCTGRNSS